MRYTPSSLLDTHNKDAWISLLYFMLVALTSRIEVAGRAYELLLGIALEGDLKVETLRSPSTSGLIRG